MGLAFGFTPTSRQTRQAALLSEQLLPHHYLVKILHGLPAAASFGSHSARYNAPPQKGGQRMSRFGDMEFRGTLSF